jgi:hypothetical protein
MPSLNAVITADATQFEREIARMQRIAGLAGGRIGSAMSGGHGEHGGGRGSMMESIVVAREVLEGRGIARIIGSITLLGQRLGWLNLLFKVHKGELTLAAEADEAAAIQAGLHSLALTRKAAASSAAFMAGQAGTEATLEQAAADDIAATAARANAVALQKKAEASLEAAAASKEEATLTVGALGVVAAALVGLAIGAYAAYKYSEALIVRLSSVKMPDFEPKYIAEHLQKANQVAEGWKEIARAVDKAKDAYDSAAESAQRIAEATKSTFEFQRKALSIHRETELGMASSPLEKNAINKKYDAQEIALNDAERKQTTLDKIDEKIALQKEAALKKSQADAVVSSTDSKELDDENIRLAKVKLDAANKAAKEIEDDRQAGGLTASKRFIAANLGTDSGVSTKDIIDAENAKLKGAKDAETAYRAIVNLAAANEVKRKDAAEKTAKAAEDLGKAAHLTKEINAKMKQDDIDHGREVLLAQAENYKRMSEIKLEKPELTANQKIGAYAFREGQTLLDVSRKQLDALYKIIGGMDKLGANHGHEEY